MVFFSDGGDSVWDGPQQQILKVDGRFLQNNK